MPGVQRCIRRIQSFSQNALTEDTAGQSVAYWRDLAQQLLSDPETPDGSSVRKAYAHMPKLRLISLRTTISMTRPNRHIASPAHFGQTIAKFWAASQNYLSSKAAWTKRTNCSINSHGPFQSNKAA